MENEQKQEAETEKTIQSPGYTKPTQLNMPISRLTDAFFGRGAFGDPNQTAELMDKVGKKGIGVNVSPKDEKPVVVERCYLDLNDNGEVTFTKKINSFDLSVFSAYCSVLESGNDSCTAVQIYRAMTGDKKKNINSDSPIIDKIDDSMCKMMSTLAQFDWSNQAKEWNIDTKQLKVEAAKTPIIPAISLLIKYPNGEKAWGYFASVEPPLYQYAKAVRQMVSVKNDVLQINGRVSEKSILIRDYLIGRIGRMKSSKQNSKTSPYIRFDTIAEKCQIEVNSRQSEDKLRKAVFNILDRFKECGYINDYIIANGERGKIVSVQIKI